MLQEQVGEGTERKGLGKSADHAPDTGLQCLCLCKDSSNLTLVHGQ
jgi:hypothetical protein